jgi:hypothetical protein
MQIFKNLTSKKQGQSLVEYILIGSLVAVVGFYGLVKLNPTFFKNYFKGSVSPNGSVDSNGQLTMPSMGT